MSKELQSNSHDFKSITPEYWRASIGHLQQKCEKTGQEIDLNPDSNAIQLVACSECPQMDRDECPVWNNLEQHLAPPAENP